MAQQYGKNEWEFTDPLGSLLFNRVNAAHEWGKLPSELGICKPEEDLAFMTAFLNSRSDVRAFEEGLRREEANKPKPPKKGR